MAANKNFWQTVKPLFFMGRWIWFIEEWICLTMKKFQKHSRYVFVILQRTYHY